MKTDKDYINQAINELMGKATVGSIIGHRSDEIAYSLSDIINDTAICILPNGKTKTFPVAEIFDVNMVKNRAIELKFIDAFEVDRTN